MPKYVYKPVEVEAFKIVSTTYVNEGVKCDLENGDSKLAEHDMTARYTPVPGDYWVIQPDGYEYLNPKDVFEKKFEISSETQNEKINESSFSFGIAINLLKDGRKVARNGWNGKGMFIYMVPANKYPVNTKAAKSYFGENSFVPYNAYFAVKNVNETVSTWAPSINDCLAEDWMQVE